MITGMNKGVLVTLVAMQLGGLLQAEHQPTVLRLAPPNTTIEDRFSASSEVLLRTNGTGPTLIFKPSSGQRSNTYARITNTEPLNSDEHYRLGFEMRAVPEVEATSGQAGLQISLGALEPGAELKRGQIERQTVAVVANEWESFAIDFQAKRNYMPGEFIVDLRPAFFREIIEVRGLSVNVFGDDQPPPLMGGGEAYPGHAPDAPWRAEARERIAKHRMALLQVTVLDEWGQPLEGAQIEVRMAKHRYLFGTCVKAFRLTDAKLQYTRPEFNRETWLADNVIYREKLKELFNFAVFENDLKWPSWSGHWPNSKQSITLEAMQWLAEHDFVVKGHTMLWGSWRQSPTYLEAAKDDPALLNAAIEAHLRDQGDAMRDWVQYADVLNEAQSHNDIIQVVGEDKVTGWFKTAETHMPGVKLVINEFNILGNGGSKTQQNAHEAFVRRLIDDGAPIDVLGFQSHFWSTRLTPPERLYNIINRFSSFGLPLTVSEFDMNILDEQLQADYTRDFLTVWFSHPATESYIMWGFWAKAHWLGETGAMFREDWTPKPNLTAYTDLVFGEWWTEEDLVTDANGEAACRAFLGDYAIIVSAPGRQSAPRQVSLDSNGLDLTVMLYPLNEML